MSLGACYLRRVPTPFRHQQTAYSSASTGPQEID